MPHVARRPRNENASRGNWTLSRLSRDRGGNFGLITAIVIPVLLGAAGVAIDVNRMLSTKTALQGVVDAAALAASSGLSENGITSASAELLAVNWVKSHAAQGETGFGLAGLDPDAKVATTQRSDGGKAFDVTVTASYRMELTPFMHILGKETVDISVVGTARSETTVQNAMSMFFVLDRSGSMLNSTTSVKSLKTSCTRYAMPTPLALVNLGKMKPCMYSQMEALQNSADDLFDLLDKNDKDRKFIRTGAVSYNASAQAPSPPAWDRTAAREYVKELEPEGGTSSTKAFEKAYESLIDPLEDTAHKNKNGLKPKKYIIFMTDGSNSSSSDNTKTVALCKKAKDAGITVYSVAFNAPLDAKLFLMQCASGINTYFDAVDASALAMAFETIGRSAVGLPPRLTK